MIQIENLVKVYGSNTVLNNINFTIKKGEIIGMIGASGGGKTTLLRCLHGLEETTSGKIHMNGQTGLVFQHFNLFPHMTVLENIIYTPIKVYGVDKEKAKKRALELLEIVDLSAKVDFYPSALSGGQKQRVAIARALAPNPKILMLDEPTSALDPALIKKMVKVMQRLADDGVTLLIVSHDMSFLEQATQKILFLSKGEIVEEAKTNDFFANPQSNEAIFFLNHLEEIVEDL